MEKVKRAMALYISYFLFRRTPTLVYSVERSGSVALLHSLQSQGVFAIGAHYLSPEKLAQPRYCSGSAGWAGKHIISRRKPAKVISMVRQPIENMLSTFAREYYGHHDSARGEAAGDSIPSSAAAEGLAKEFCQTYLQSDDYLRPLCWFEREFRPALGIDIYQHPFDKEKRFVSFREQPYEVLILRTELEDEQKSKLVADFVGIPQLKISSAAVAAQTSASRKQHRLPPGKPGEQTAYAQKYQALKQHVVIPNTYLDAIIESRYVQHFFSRQEQEAMRCKYGGEVTREP